MVQAIPNRAEIVGRISAIGEAPGTPDFLTATVYVEQANVVPGFANMMEWAKGKDVTVLVPRERASELSLRPNDVLKCTVEKVGPRQHYASPEGMETV